MKTTNAVPQLTLLAMCLAVGTALADQIVLRDGDRITGTIVSKDGDVVNVDSKNFGAIKLKWSDIATVTADKPLHVVLSGDRQVQGTLATEGSDVVVAATGETTRVAPADVLTLRNDAEEKKYQRLLHPGLLDLWTVTGSLNVAGTRGNAVASTLTTPFTFVRTSSTSRTSAYFNAIRSTASINGVSAETAQAVRGGWAYNRNITKRTFLTGFNDYEYDRFQALDLRVVLGGGAGYQFWRTDTGRFDLVGGGAWNREKFGPPAPALPFTRNSAEGYWGDDFNLKLNSRTSLIQAFRMFHNLSNSGEYRINFDAGATMSLMKWLNWNLSVSDRYLSNPVPGRKRNDFLYSTGFGFTFAR